MPNINSTRVEGTHAIGTPKRKISRAEWQAIGARHAKGESLASIARDYKCTAPAIRYIVNTGRRLAGPAYVEAHQEKQPADGQADRVNCPAFGIDDVDAFMHSPAASARTAGPSGGASTGRFDVSLREAMMLEISGFLVAFDAVVTEESPEAFNRLREAADRLLRATARIRIELERGPKHSVGRAGS